MDAKKFFIIFLYGFLVYSLSVAFSVNSYEALEYRLVSYQDNIDLDTTDLVERNFSYYNETGESSGDYAFDRYSDIIDPENYSTSEVDLFFGNLGRLFTSIGIMITTTVGFLTFSIIEPTNMFIPSYIRILFFFAVLPVWMALIYYLGPIAIRILRVIAHWMNAVIPF